MEENRNNEITTTEEPMKEATEQDVSLLTLSTEILKTLALIQKSKFQDKKKEINNSIQETIDSIESRINGIADKSSSAYKKLLDTFKTYKSEVDAVKEDYLNQYDALNSELNSLTEDLLKLEYRKHEIKANRAKNSDTARQYKLYSKNLKDAIASQDPNRINKAYLELTNFMESPAFKNSTEAELAAVRQEIENKKKEIDNYVHKVEELELVKTNSIKDIRMGFINNLPSIKKANIVQRLFNKFFPNISSKSLTNSLTEQLEKSINSTLPNIKETFKNFSTKRKNDLNMLRESLTDKTLNVIELSQEKTDNIKASISNKMDIIKTSVSNTYNVTIDYGKEKVQKGKEFVADKKDQALNFYNNVKGGVANSYNNLKKRARAYLEKKTGELNQRDQRNNVKKEQYDPTNTHLTWKSPDHHVYDNSEFGMENRKGINLEKILLNNLLELELELNEALENKIIDLPASDRLITQDPNLANKRFQHTIHDDQPEKDEKGPEL